MQTNPKISVITVVYNAAALIEPTMQSVLQQTYPHVEYIIMDGASSDGTLEIIEKYRYRLGSFCSEKDRGIYDAMNKGLERATGEYVLFLNAGDLLADETTLARVFATDEDADVYYGNTKIIDNNGNVLGDRRLRPPSQLTWKSLRLGMCVSHQSFIARRNLCEPYDLLFVISSDIDWVIRVLKKARKIVYVNTTISKFLEGGTSAKKRRTALIERFQIMTRHYGLPGTIFNHIYILLRYLFHRISRKSMS
jgi:glycosyltransferase involved in cell wall biosynthesis